MTDTPETQPVEGAEILRLLRTIDAQVRSNGAVLSRCEIAINDVRRQLHGPDADGDRLADMRAQLDGMSEVLQRAAPLLDSAPARALAGGNSVLSMLSRKRPAAGG